MSDAVPGAKGVVNLFWSPLRQDFSNVSVQHYLLGNLLKLWAPPQGFRFTRSGWGLTCSQVMRLLVQGPHFENRYSQTHCRDRYSNMVLSLLHALDVRLERKGVVEYACI